jgi:hypothetical protein
VDAGVGPGADVGGDAVGTEFVPDFLGDAGVRGFGCVCRLVCSYRSVCRCRLVCRYRLVCLYRLDYTLVLRSTLMSPNLRIRKMNYTLPRNPKTVENKYLKKLQKEGNKQKPWKGPDATSLGARARYCAT